jgi:uncharacterized membrane protein
VWLAGVGALGGWVASLAGLVDLLAVARSAAPDHRLGPRADGGDDAVAGHAELALRLGDDPGVL